MKPKHSGTFCGEFFKVKFLVKIKIYCSLNFFVIK